MSRRPILKSLAVLGIVVLFAVVDPVAAEAQRNARNVAGSYLGALDLTPLGFGPRIEGVYVVLDRNGAVLFTSEHEDDKESAGVGVWQRLPGGIVGMGIASFRLGPDPATSICGLLGLTSPPDNCILKIGGTVGRYAGGGLEGEMFLTVETLDATVTLTFPAPLPISLERLSLEDFPGALP